MINTVNIDLSNSSCWGTANDACDGNEIFLYIKLLESLLEKTDVHLEFTKPDGVIVTTDNLTVVNEQVSYEIPFNLYVTKGTLKLRILATDYTSDYINFSILDNYTETDNIYVKFNSTTKEFETSKCEVDLWIDLPLLNNATQYANNEAYKCKYKKIGKEVIVVGCIKGVAAANTIIAQLPEGYRPSYQFRYLTGRNAASNAIFQVNTSGQIMFVNLTQGATITETDYIYIQTSFYID